MHKELSDQKYKILKIKHGNKKINTTFCIVYIALHKAALVLMIKVLSGETDTGNVEIWMTEQKKEFPLFKLCLGKAWIRSLSAELPDAP